MIISLEAAIFDNALGDMVLYVGQTSIRIRKADGTIIEKWILTDIQSRFLEDVRTLMHVSGRLKDETRIIKVDLRWREISELDR